MENLASKKPLFIGLSCLSIGCLIGSWAYPLQKLEIYKQQEKQQFDIQVIRTYVITEDSLNYPYGFQRDKAKKFAQIHIDYKIQKILLLALAAGCSIAAMSIGYELVPLSEFEDEISRIKNEAKKELTLKGIKARFALANKSQQLLFLDEMKALMDEFGSAEQEMLEADEINALYAEAQAEKPDEEAPATDEQGFRSQFPETMDDSSWKACLRALGDGASREDIIKDVLSGGVVASAYFDFLKGKFL